MSNTDDTSTVEAKEPDTDIEDSAEETSTDKSQDKSDKDQSKETDDTEDEDFDTESETFDPARALKKLRKQNREIAALRARTKEAEEKVTTTEADKDKEISALQSELLKERIGRKTGLPEEIVTRLQGDTEEEMLKDAESFLELFQTSSPPSSRPKEKLRGGSKPDSEPEEIDVDRIAERMFRR